MLARIARDRAVRSLPIWTIAALVNSSVLLGWLAWHAASRGTSVPAPALLLVTWLGVAVYLAFGHVRTRCTRFDLALPIPTGRLWLAHVLAVVAGGAVVAAVSILAVALHHGVLGGRSSSAIGPTGLALALGAGLLLATLLLQVPRRSLSHVPVTRRYVLWAAAVLAGVPALLTAALVTRPVGPAVFVLLLLAVGAWVYRSIPPTFALVPLEPERPGRVPSAGTTTAGSDGERSRLVLPLAIVRGVSAGAKEALMAVLMLIIGMILGGALEAIEQVGFRELRFVYVAMAAYLLFAFIGPKLSSLHHLDPLPIARRPIFAVMLLPSLLVFFVGYCAGTVAASGARSRLEYVNFEERDGGFEVTVPLRVYEVAWDAAVPAFGSPWGESWSPEPLRPWSASRAIVYSPYSAPPGSSARFVALQMSRAVERAYGASISPGEIEERYLVTREDGTVVPRGEGLTLRTDYPDLWPRSGPMFPVLAAATAVPWFLLVAALLRAYRPCVKEWIRQTIYWGSLALMLVFFIVTSLGTITNLARPWAVRALVEIPVMRLGGTPAGILAVWAICVLLVGGAYWVAQSQFQRMEIPTRPSKYTLVDRMREKD